MDKGKRKDCIIFFRKESERIKTMEELKEKITKLISELNLTGDLDYFQKMTMTLEDLVPHLDEVGLLKLNKRLEILAGNKNN